MQTYVGLLCQDLVKRHELSPGLLLPPVLLLVFYNGAPPWNATLDLAKLLMAPPAQRYALIDQQRLDRAALDANPDLLALLFRIELSLFPEVLTTHMPLLKTWFRDTPQTSLRTSVWAWWKALLARKTDDALFNLDSAEEYDMSELKPWDRELEEIARQKGFVLTEKAKEEGRAEGQVAALRAALDKLLRVRFGTLPEHTAQRVGGATRAELERWLERTVTAPSLAALFGDDAAAG
jgi:hypothetical protein